jgi:hypothetical protein
LVGAWVADREHARHSGVFVDGAEGVVEC